VSAWPWRTLGLSPTSDRKEIRSAYARKLKSGKFDEPDAFARLRAARDEALARAAAGDLPVAAAALPEEDADAPPSGLSLVPPVFPHDATGVTTGPIDAGDEAMPMLSGGFEPDSGAGASLPVSHASLAVPGLAGHAMVAAVGPQDLRSDLRGVCQGIYDVLEGGAAEDVLDADQAAALRDDTARAIRLAANEGVDQQADFETWLAELIARTMPRSDPILDMASATFDWVERAKMIDAPPVIAWLGQRRAATAFIAKLERPEHRWHRAYRELTAPADASSKRGRWVRGGNVRDLLKYIRTNHPSAEQSLDPWRVELWEAPASGGGDGWGGIVTVVVIVLFNIGRVFSTSPAPNTPVPVMAPPVQQSMPLAATPEAAIAAPLSSIGDPALTVEALKEHNPALFADLKELWERTAANKGSGYDFDTAAGDIVRNRAELALGTAGYDISRERVMALRKMTARFQAEHPRYCVDFLHGKVMSDEWLTDYRASYRRVVALALLERSTPASMRARSEHFAIPGEVMGDIARRTHLDDRTIRSVLDETSSNEDQQCKVRIALMDAALAAKPKVALPMLRGL
jgi:hypothetical protein